MISKKPSEMLDLEKDLPTTSEDVRALRENRPKAGANWFEQLQALADQFLRERSMQQIQPGRAWRLDDDDMGEIVRARVLGDRISRIIRADFEAIVDGANRRSRAESLTNRDGAIRTDGPRHRSLLDRLAWRADSRQRRNPLLYWLESRADLVRP